MKQYNKFIVGALMGTILPFFAVSCKVSPDVLTEETKVKSIANVIELGTQLAVSTTVYSKPETRAYFGAVVIAVDTVLGGKDLTPGTVINTINSFVKGVDNNSEYFSIVEGAIQLALNAYKRFYELNIQKTIQPYLVTLLEGLKNGVEAGMAKTGPAPAGANPISELTDADLTL